jgi:hypothetical protein
VEAFRSRFGNMVESDLGQCPALLWVLVYNPLGHFYNAQPYAILSFGGFL